MTFVAKNKNLFHVIALFCVLIAGSLVFRNNPLLPVSKRVSKPKTIEDKTIPIITYHYVEIVTDERDFIRKDLSVSPQFFEKNIIDAKNKGYEFVFQKDIPGLLVGEIKVEKPIVFTFDDGYRDFYTDAFPIIKKHNVKVTVFVVPNFVGLNKNYMTRDQIVELLKSGLVEIGSHSMSHRGLVSLTNSQAEMEIYGSKGWLEEVFSVSIESFAYPYGSYDADIEDLVKKAGYKSAASVEKDTIQSISNLFHLSRISSGSIYSVL